MEKKWKLSKEDACNHSSSSSTSFLKRSKSQSQKGSSKSPLQRSFSHKTTTTSSSSKSSNSKSPSLSRAKSANFTTKCSSFTKEHKARFYILKRCISMLVSWNKHHNDSWSLFSFFFLIKFNERICYIS